MQYALMFYEAPADFAKRESAEAQAYYGSWMAYIDAIDKAKIRIAGGGLQPPMTGTSLRLRGDKRQVQDGPFADTKEQLGGFVIIEVPELDAALEWAARAPCASTGGVEVRPVLRPPGA